MPCPQGLDKQSEKNTFSLYTCTYYSAYKENVFLYIGNRKFIVANKYNILKKSEPHFLSD